MAITLPADPACKECGGFGQTVDRYGYTHACRACWDQAIRRMLLRQRGGSEQSGETGGK
jgi:hypothetical protein